MAEMVSVTAGHCLDSSPGGSSTILLVHAATLLQDIG